MKITNIIDKISLVVSPVITKAPFAGVATGPNPTDRGKRGTKRSQLSDGRGMPLALFVDGANRHDMKRVEDTLDHIMLKWPVPTQEEPQHLSLDASYEAVHARHDEPHIRPNHYNQAHGKSQAEQPVEPVNNALESTKKPRRWVVERLHSWLNRSRRLLIRWEKLPSTYAHGLRNEFYLSNNLA